MEKPDNTDKETVIPNEFPSNIAIVVIKPDAVENAKDIKMMLESSGIKVIKSKILKLRERFLVEEMYKDLPDSIREETLKHFNIDDAEVLLVRGGDDIVEKLGEITGKETNPDLSEKGTVRYKYGEHFHRDTDDGRKYFRNAIHRAKNEQERVEDLRKFKGVF